MALLEEIALGLYIGVLTGMFTALLIFGVGFVFQYVSGSPFPGTIGLMIGLGAAGLQGGMFRLMRDSTMLKSPVILSALLVVLLITNYSQKRAQDLAKAAPSKSEVLAKLRNRTLSPEVVKQLGRFGQVRVTVAGEVMDLEGYPPLSATLRSQLREEEWTFPADLPLPELEKRLSEQLMTDHDLEDVVVDIDQQGQATISAAPPSSGLSRKVPTGTQAATIEALVPTGLAYGDEVNLKVGEASVTGSVVSVTPPEAMEKNDHGDAPAPTAVQTAAGGQARIAVAVDRRDVPAVIGSETEQFVVEPRGRNREYELVSLLRQRGNGFQKVPVRSDGPLAGRSIADLDLRGTHGVDILALKRGDAWQFAPVGTTVLEGEDELFITGPTAAIGRIQGGPTT